MSIEIHVQYCKTEIKICLLQTVRIPENISLLKIKKGKNYQRKHYSKTVLHVCKVSGYDSIGNAPINVMPEGGDHGIGWRL